MTDGDRVETHCPYCALQCGMTLRRADDLISVEPREFPTNRGGLCQKGWTAADLLDHPERLRTPLVRRDGELQPATWDEALTLVASTIKSIQRRYDENAVAVFGGGGLTNEKSYALGKFARVALRTRNIDYNGRFCMSSAAAAGIRAFGIDRGLPFPLEDVGSADTLLLVGANVAETMPPFGRWLADQKARGGTLIVVDPRATPTAKQATLHLQPTPGTDLAIANALLHIALTEGLLDKDYLAERTTGFDDVRRTVANYWPARVERLTGVPVADLERTARALAGGERVIILTARGAEQHAKGVDTVTAFINLALALGLPGRPGSGYGCLTGQGNGQGGREHGQKADQLPGYRKIDDPAARAHVGGVWGVDPASLPGPGVSAYELLDALGTEAGPKAMLLFGSNPVVSAPRAGRVTERIRSLEFLVVADFLLSETAALADVVLPTAMWAEEDGTMTNLEGRVLRRHAIRRPPGQARTDLEILHDLATRLGTERGFPADPAEVFGELRRASAGGVADYAGVTWERIDAHDGVFWPCPDTDGPDTPRMFAERFGTPDGRARMVAVEHRAAAEEPCADYPLYLTTGRVLAQYQSGTQTRRVGALRRAAPHAFVELHPDLAARLGVADGESLTVTSRRGEVTAPARLSDAIRADTVFMPFHWAGAGRANSLTNDALDPTSRMPEFKVCAVRVERAFG
ncbi:molybdopterin oxidoreductase family protein [Catenuloplanes indicus]|uniref:Assimilatory nitrate reductase catalytic subunit n=1 Tax=Catenuloplanes indicus TaxID=137267 RepID=A0AAE3VYV3_9ACTN|nr:molybdopterin-dependent oxidoreductase [Catenuloplanes indicus]MDQ0366381.1 assimilatory nitrate reductase catalytic subunit [Catenuloplanes indicus]